MNENINLGSTALITPDASVAAAPRTLDMVAAEIRTFTASMLNNIIEIGRRMCEAKEMLPYGKFGEWIKENTGYSRSTANNFMRVYQEYGTRQGCLFGATVENDQTFGKLSYTQALALLALPSGEREEFVETHDIENMSTRELQAAIAERDAARKALDTALSDAAKAEKYAAALSHERDEARRAMDDALEGAKKAEQEADALRAKIEELEKRPAAVEPDREAIDKAVAEAVEKASAAHSAELEKLKASEEKKRKALEKKAADAERTAKAAEEKAAEAGKNANGEADALREEAEQLKAEADRLRRELAMSGEATVTFKLYFAAWQKDYANMMGALAQADEDTAGRLRAAIKAQIGGWENG